MTINGFLISVAFGCITYLLMTLRYRTRDIDRLNEETSRDRFQIKCLAREIKKFKEEHATEMERIHQCLTYWIRTPSPDPLCIKELETKIAHVEKKMCDLMGITVDLQHQINELDNEDVPLGSLDEERRALKDLYKKNPKLIGEEMVPYQEAAKLLGLSYQHLATKRNAGSISLHPYKGYNRVFFKKSDLTRVLKERESKSNDKRG